LAVRVLDADVVPERGVWVVEVDRHVARLRRQRGRVVGDLTGVGGEAKRRARATTTATAPSATAAAGSGRGRRAGGAAAASAARDQGERRHGGKAKGQRELLHQSLQYLAG